MVLHYLFTTNVHEKSTFWMTLRKSHPFLWTASFFFIFQQMLTFSLVLLLLSPPFTWLGGIGPHCGRSWISLLAGIMEWAVKMIKDSSNIPPLGGGGEKRRLCKIESARRQAALQTADSTHLYCRLPLTYGVYRRTNNGCRSVWKLVMFRSQQFDNFSATNLPENSVAFSFHLGSHQTHGPTFNVLYWV